MSMSKKTEDFMKDKLSKNHWIWHYAEDFDNIVSFVVILNSNGQKYKSRFLYA